MSTSKHFEVISGSNFGFVKLTPSGQVRILKTVCFSFEWMQFWHNFNDCFGWLSC
ncbi:hypothetical protein LDENG_00156360 [Lucifuga dentata]|nr:hypothetical protein LDENG_00156360 [Lucifuga dentata]